VRRALGYRRQGTGLLAALVLAVTLTACGGADGGTAQEPAGGGNDGGAATSDLKVGLAYDIGGRGDQSFNDAAARGLDQAKKELGVEARELEAGTNESNAEKEERLRLLADGGFSPIIAVGFAYSEPLAKVAAEFPDTRFAIVDDAQAKGENISNLLFAEEQGSFLVGAAAALKSKANNVGFIGGVNVPLIQKFEAGYKAGAEAAKPGITVQSKYLTQPPDFTGFGDEAKGRTAAQGMYDAGADVVYHAAGASGGGVFAAAKAAGGLAIGVDSDQYQTANPELREVILTSMLKRVDVAVSDFISSVAEDKFAAGPKIYDLEANGVDYATSGGKVDDIEPQLEDYKQQIISGEITVAGGS